MDSKVVNKQIRAEIRPFLKEEGFTRFTGRTSWRYEGSRIDVINFQSFNSYTAEVMGCTTYSFAVNLGCYFTDIPDEPWKRMKAKDDGLRPEEYQCPFRGRLRRSFHQAEYDGRQVWYVDPDGRHLDQAIHDVRMAIVRDGLPWFKRLRKAEDALQVLQEEESTEELWGWGNKGSPKCDYLIGCFALSAGNKELAERHLRKAWDCGMFEAEFVKRIERRLARLK